MESLLLEGSLAKMFLKEWEKGTASFMGFRYATCAVCFLKLHLFYLIF